MANRGRPIKSKRGKTRDESVDPKLGAIQRKSKLQKNLYDKKFGEGVKTGAVSLSEKEEETSKKTSGNVKYNMTVGQEFKKAMVG